MPEISTKARERFVSEYVRFIHHAVKFNAYRNTYPYTMYEPLSGFARNCFRRTILGDKTRRAGKASTGVLVSYGIVYIAHISRPATMAGCNASPDGKAGNASASSGRLSHTYCIRATASLPICHCRQNTNCESWISSTKLRSLFTGTGSLQTLYTSDRRMYILEPRCLHCGRCLWTIGAEIAVPGAKKSLFSAISMHRFSRRFSPKESDATKTCTTVGMSVYVCVGDTKWEREKGWKVRINRAAECSNVSYSRDVMWLTSIGPLEAVSSVYVLACEVFHHTSVDSEWFKVASNWPSDYEVENYVFYILYDAFTLIHYVISYSFINYYFFKIWHHFHSLKCISFYNFVLYNPL